MIMIYKGYDIIDVDSMPSLESFRVLKYEAPIYEL